jgi:hypothetical protein
LVIGAPVIVNYMNNLYDISGLVKDFLEKEGPLPGGNGPEII